MIEEVFTKNGAKAYSTSGNAIVDLFYFGGSSRKTTESKILDIFKKALSEHKLFALRTLFYLRDIRGGQGERRFFRICLSYLAKHEKSWLKNNLNLISEYGRYDDYLILLSSSLKDDVLKFLQQQFEKDLLAFSKNEYTNISLLAKWLPSEHSIKYAHEVNIIQKSGLFGTNKEYRQNLVKLRKALDVLEIKLASKDYTNINYNNIPSKAINKYGKKYIKHGKEGAFLRNDNENYTKYLEAVENNKEYNGKIAKINANAIYPYDVISNYFIESRSFNKYATEDKMIDLQWKSLPDYVNELNGLVIYDTSGSMNGLPLKVAMSLALYTSERNKNLVWKNYVIPFSSTAEFKEVKGDTVLERLRSIYTGDCSNTNLEAVFNLILSRAIMFNVSEEDMPKQLLIVSDMQFDAFSFNFSAIENIKAKYKKAGYDLPQLIWWNVCEDTSNVPVTIDQSGNLLLSGSSPSLLKVALNGKKGLLETVYSIICNERYLKITY